MTDGDVGLIVLLLPLAAAMVVFQENPYHALVVRGILGAIATLVYGVLGAADVALTEALMGTMLAIALYAVAVRSSLVLRVGVLATCSADSPPGLTALWDELRRGIAAYHLRLELVPYDDRAALAQALADRDVHGVCTRSPGLATDADEGRGQEPPYDLALRVARLYEILRETVTVPTVRLRYVPGEGGASLGGGEASPGGGPGPLQHSRVDSSGDLVSQEPHP